MSRSCEQVTSVCSVLRRLKAAADVFLSSTVQQEQAEPVPLGTAGSADARYQLYHC